MSLKENSISIIVPIYNGEKYIKRAVESVLPQLNDHIELILVDDGSTDDSAFICDSYAEKNKNILVVHKNNGGLPSARNAGIEVASGAYIAFLDADDYVSEDTYEIVTDVVNKYSPDFIDYGWNYVSCTGEISRNEHGLPKNKLLERKIIEDAVLPPLLNIKSDDKFFIFNYCWNKIYRTEVIRRYHIRFDEHRRTWEDRLFVVEFLRYSQNMFSIDKCLYYYVFSKASLSQRWDDQYFSIIVQNYRRYLELYGDKYNFNTEYVYRYWCNAIENMIFLALKQVPDKKELILRCISDKVVIQWFSNRNSTSLFEKTVQHCLEKGYYAAAYNCFVVHAHMSEMKIKIYKGIQLPMRIGKRLVLQLFASSSGKPVN